LKLLQLQKKGSLRVDEYSLVPKLIQKEMDQYKVNNDIDKYRLIMIKNEYYAGFMEVSLARRQDMDQSAFVLKATETFNNYEDVRRGLKNCERASEQFKREVHFDYAIFL
jgi:ribosomal protein RSM22 (predicted rRNA methylase)